VAVSCKLQGVYYSTLYERGMLGYASSNYQYSTLVVPMTIAKCRLKCVGYNTVNK